MIPYGKQNIDESDIKAVVDVLNSDFLTQGPITPNFETEISDQTPDIKKDQVHKKKHVKHKKDSLNLW